MSITCSRKKKNAGYCIFAQKRLRKTKQFIIHNVSVSTACITQSQCILKCYIRLSKSMKSVLKQQKTVNLSLDVLILYIFIPFYHQHYQPSIQSRRKSTNYCNNYIYLKILLQIKLECNENPLPLYCKSNICSQ